ncbi:hypothetical protein ACGK9U_00905 [Mariniflexile sp. HNIBRBA6329]|uniref:hypothetical protein n=1 Tax=Mariniflexile sp. HNIBRBA6329 TaxID=3373088 RepID=UPI003745397D
MNIEKAVNRIKWRILGNGWKANQIDIDALNRIINYVIQKEKEQINRQELFAKLYIHTYSQFIEKYKSNVYDDIPTKELHKLLEQPLIVHIQKFTDKLNDIEQENLFDSLKFRKDHPATIPQEIKVKETEALSEALKDKENEKKLFLKTWEEDLVREILFAQINNFLNIYYDVKTD